MPNTRHNSLVLVADIGGTNARFGLADPGNDHPLLLDSIHHYPVADFPSLEAAAHEYLREVDTQPGQAVLAVAGRIRGNEVSATNSPWRIVVSQVCDALQLADTRLINDFAAQSLCLPLLDVADAISLGPLPPPVVGQHAAQTFAVLGPGTGLGVGALLRRESRYHALESEGGHCDFAPCDAEEIEILRHLNRRFGRVSNERLVCGVGLTNLHLALAELGNQHAEPLSPEQITARADSGSDPLCAEVIQQFCAIFGSVAGNAVLHLGSWDGAFLAGGLAPRLLPWLQKSRFRERFEAKGRLSEAMRNTPSIVITHPQAGLLGAAASALFARQQKAHGSATAPVI